MCSYDTDSFREFIQIDGFEKVFELSEEEKKFLIDDEDELLQFACRFLKQVLYGEHSIPTREDAKQSRLNRLRPGT
jgi:hypothetical protein